MDKISKEDFYLIELHKANISQAEKDVDLHNTKFQLLIANLFRKYNLQNNDQIAPDGSIVKAEMLKPKETEEVMEKTTEEIIKDE